MSKITIFVPLLMNRAKDDSHLASKQIMKYEIFNEINL